MKMRLSALFSVAISLLLVLSLTGCRARGTPAGNEGPIKIGTIQDLTGGASISGIPNARGVVYAVEEINAAGGIHGRMIELTVLDCANDPNEGVNAYRRLVEEIGVHAIVGPPLSNVALAWVHLSAEDRIPVVGHFMDEAATTNPDNGQPFPYMFLVQPGSALHASAVANYAMNTLGFRTFATIYNSANAFSVSQAGPFIRYVESQGGRVLVRDTFSWADTDVSAQAIRVAQANPDAVYISDFAVQARMVVNQLRQAGYQGYILGANTLGTSFRELMPGVDLSRVYFVANYDETDFSTKTAQLVQRFMREEGVNYWSGNVGFGYDATTVLAHAMQMANDPTNGAEVRDILASRISGVQASSSPITLNPRTHRPVDVPLFIGRHFAQEGTEFIASIIINESDITW